MDLCLASHRALFKALQAFEDGELALAIDAPLTVVTAGGDLRLLDGVCFAAPRDAWIGAELIGWLEELDGLSGVGAWWRPGLRAVLRTRDGRVDVAAGSQDLLVDGARASAGLATHTARFIVAHGDGDGPHAAPAPTLQVARTAPASPRAPAPTLPAARPARAPAPTPAPSTRPLVDGGVPLRERGLWRSTAVVPWNLGKGRPVTRAPREAFGPLPPVAPPPARPPAYTPTRECVHMPSPRPPVYTPTRECVHISPPRRRASSIDLSHVA